MRWWDRFKLWLAYRKGRKDCPQCDKPAGVRWVKDVVLFEDEPPLFFHWECDGCGFATGPTPSSLTVDAAAKVGSEDLKRRILADVRRSDMQVLEAERASRGGALSEPAGGELSEWEP